MGRIKQKTASMKHIVSEDFEFFHYRDSHIRSFEFKNHEIYEIFFLISGNVTYLVDGRTYKLVPGDILLINNKELHKPVVGPKEIYERIIIWVKPEFLINHSTEDCDLAACFEHISNIRHNHVRFDPSMQKKVKTSILLLEEACNSNEFGSNILRNSYLMQIIVYLNRYFTGVPETSLQIDIGSNEKINNVIKYIHENLTGDLSLDTLANMFYTDKYYLLHQFKLYTGYTIHQYVQQKRLITAKLLLKEGKSALEACEESGFGDYANFIRAFKRAFGIPPGRYRKTNSI